MSRYGTPASDLGRLAIGGSSTSSSGDMPVTTRAMRRGQGNGPESQQSSSRAVAGPSRGNGRSSGTQRQAQASRRTPGRGGDGDSDGDDDNDSSDESGDEDAATVLRGQNRLAAFEIAAALDQNLQAPQELVSANPRDPQRRLADAMASRFQDQADLNTLRGILSQAEALDRVSANFRKRYQTIVSRIAVNVENSVHGMSVAEGFRAFRNLANAVGQHMDYYVRRRALPDSGRGLVGILMEILTYITDQDEDLYATARVARAQYAGGGNTGNIFREFVREHLWVREVLMPVPVPLLRERRQAFEAVIGKVRAHGPTHGDRAQFQQLVNVLFQIYQRMQAAE